LPGDPPNPGAELRIAGVDPLVLGAAFLAPAGVLYAGDHTGLITRGNVSLGGINVVLAVFNAIPVRIVEPHVDRAASMR
jgi:hypothetical protein